MEIWDGLFSHLKLDIETINEIKQIVKRREKESNYDENDSVKNQKEMMTTLMKIIDKD